jgi:hypothetical protein
MPILKGLPDTKRDKQAVMVRTVSAILSALRDKKGAIGAGDYGSITIWVDDNKHYRCEAMRYYSTQNSTQPKTLKAVAKWARAWLPWCQDGDLRTRYPRKGK